MRPLPPDARTVSRRQWNRSLECCGSTAGRVRRIFVCHSDPRFHVRALPGVDEPTLWEFPKDSLPPMRRGTRVDGAILLGAGSMQYVSIRVGPLSMCGQCRRGCESADWREWWPADSPQTVRVSESTTPARLAVRRLVVSQRAAAQRILQTRRKVFISNDFSPRGNVSVDRGTGLLVDGPSRSFG